MSKITLSGNASGTGTLTVAAPNTNTDRTLTLPDETGTVITTAAAATQANQETGSSTTTYVSPGRQQYHPSALKVFCSWKWVTGTPTIQQSYNVTSLTDSGVGNVTVNFTTAFSAATYCTTGGWQSADSSVQQQMSILNQATTSVQVIYYSNGSGTDNANICSIMCAGDQ